MNATYEVCVQGSLNDIQDNLAYAKKRKARGRLGRKSSNKELIIRDPELKALAKQVETTSLALGDAKAIIRSSASVIAPAKSLLQSINQAAELERKVEQYLDTQISEEEKIDSLVDHLDWLWEDMPEGVDPDEVDALIEALLASGEDQDEAAD